MAALTPSNMTKTPKKSSKAQVRSKSARRGSSGTGMKMMMRKMMRRKTKMMMRRTKMRKKRMRVLLVAGNDKKCVAVVNAHLNSTQLCLEAAPSQTFCCQPLP